MLSPCLAPPPCPRGRSPCRLLVNLVDGTDCLSSPSFPSLLRSPYRSIYASGLADTPAAAGRRRPQPGRAGGEVGGGGWLAGVFVMTEGSPRVGM